MKLVATNIFRQEVEIKMIDHGRWMSGRYTTEFIFSNGLRFISIFNGTDMRARWLHDAETIIANTPFFSDLFEVGNDGKRRSAKGYL